MRNKLVQHAFRQIRSSPLRIAHRVAASHRPTAAALWRLPPSTVVRYFSNDVQVQQEPVATGKTEEAPPTGKEEAKTVPIIFVEADGTEKCVQAAVGSNLLEVAHDNDVELEGACGGELACSTCHLIFPQDIYDTLPEKEDDEDDMLDLAFEVTETYVREILYAWAKLTFSFFLLLTGRGWDVK